MAIATYAAAAGAVFAGCSALAAVAQAECIVPIHRIRHYLMPKVLMMIMMINYMVRMAMMAMGMIKTTKTMYVRKYVCT